MYAIKVTTTWTKYESLHPLLFSTLAEAEEAVNTLQNRCSSTNNIKNNSYEIVSVEKILSGIH